VLSFVFPLHSSLTGCVNSKMKARETQRARDLTECIFMKLLFVCLSLSELSYDSISKHSSSPPSLLCLLPQDQWLFSNARGVRAGKIQSNTIHNMLKSLSPRSLSS